MTSLAPARRFRILAAVGVLAAAGVAVAEPRPGEGYAPDAPPKPIPGLERRHVGPTSRAFRGSVSDSFVRGFAATAPATRPATEPFYEYPIGQRAAISALNRQRLARLQAVEEQRDRAASRPAAAPATSPASTSTRPR